MFKTVEKNKKICYNINYSSIPLSLQRAENHAKRNVRNEMAENEKEEKQDKNSYSAKNLEVLEGLDAVRMRPVCISARRA